MASILVFGNSIAFGAWDERGGWVDRFRQYCIKQSLRSKFEDYYEVYNLGRPGDTSSHILKRFVNEMDARVWKDPVTVVIFAFGTNDSILEKGKVWVSEKLFERNVRKLIKLAFKYTDKVVFVGPPPVNDSLVDPMPWNKVLSYKNIQVRKYSELLRQLSKEQKCVFIDIYNDFMNKDYKNLLADGVHPNSEGHKLILEKVKSYLTTKNYIQG